MSESKSVAAVWVPNFLLILGATLMGAFVTRQWKESGTGHTYYEFIAVGAVLFIMGGALIFKRKK